MKEYRNVKKYQHNKFSPITYDAELWIDNKFIMNVTLDECTYRYNVLMKKLKSLLDKETLKEVDKVMDLKYEEGAWDGNNY
jgi:hypothetical protein